MERGAKEEIIGKQDGDSQLSTTAFELKRLWQDGSDVCGVCLAVRRGVERRIDALFYENVNDVPARQAIRQAGGFCRHHAARRPDGAPAFPRGWSESLCRQLA